MEQCGYQVWVACLLIEVNLLLQRVRALPFWSLPKLISTGFGGGGVIGRVLPLVTGRWARAQASSLASSCPPATRQHLLQWACKTLTHPFSGPFCFILTIKSHLLPVTLLLTHHTCGMTIQPLSLICQATQELVPGTAWSLLPCLWSGARAEFDNQNLKRTVKRHL